MDNKSGMNIHNVSSNSQHMNGLFPIEKDTVVTLKWLGRRTEGKKKKRKNKEFAQNNQTVSPPRKWRESNDTYKEQMWRVFLNKYLVNNRSIDHFTLGDPYANT